MTPMKRDELHAKYQNILKRSNRVRWILVAQLVGIAILGAFQFFYKLHGVTTLIGVLAVMTVVFSSGVHVRKLGKEADALSEIIAAELGETIQRVSSLSFARFILLLVPIRDREAVFGDIEEAYRTQYLPEFGPIKAQLLLWYQVIGTLAAFIWDKIMRVVTLILLFRGAK